MSCVLDQELMETFFLSSCLPIPIHSCQRGLPAPAPPFTQPKLHHIYLHYTYNRLHHPYLYWGHHLYYTYTRLATTSAVHAGCPAGHAPARPSSRPGAPVCALCVCRGRPGRVCVGAPRASSTLSGRAPHRLGGGRAETVTVASCWRGRCL